MMLGIQSLLFSLGKKSCVSGSAHNKRCWLDRPRHWVGYMLWEVSPGLACARVEPTAYFVSVILSSVLLYVVTKTRSY
jgi:hypothetical protein